MSSKCFVTKDTKATFIWSLAMALDFVCADFKQDDSKWRSEYNTADLVEGLSSHQSSFLLKDVKDSYLAHVNV